MMPLLTMLSMIGVAAASAAAAAWGSPPLIARVVLRIAVRSSLVRASLRARWVSDCRAAFSADFVFAKARDSWTRPFPEDLLAEWARKRPRIVGRVRRLVNERGRVGQWGSGRFSILTGLTHGTRPRS